MGEFSKLIMRARKFPKWMRDTGEKEKIIIRLAEEGLGNKHIALLTGLSESRIRQITRGIKRRSENLVKNIMEMVEYQKELEQKNKKMMMEIENLQETIKRYEKYLKKAVIRNIISENYQDYFR